MEAAAAPGAMEAAHEAAFAALCQRAFRDGDEVAAAVLLGVSRAYKESSNCRMEAQYALQKKKPL
eukprot:COSAG06_NODE_21915_length_741_cov_0.676012_2_plen_64_part_01